MANLAYIQITRECDQECRFCSNPPSGWKDIPLSTAKKLVDAYIRKGYEGLILSGGEPTKYPYLDKLIQYCVRKDLQVRLITNGQKIADRKFLKKLVDAGLRHLHVSIYSNKADVQAFLTKKEDSLKNIKKSLNNLAFFRKVKVDINITFNKYNTDHLSEIVEFIVNSYPFVRHFSFNNLDPTSERVKENQDTIPKLSDFGLELVKTLSFLEKEKKTFRVERVPLCYLPGFEFCSTETRKIVKNELRPLWFLDNRGIVVQKKFYRDKPPKCKFCFLDEICAGLCSMDRHYSSRELSPVFVSKKDIIQDIIVND